MGNPLIALGGDDVVIPLVEAWGGVAEIAESPTMSGCADILNFRLNVNTTLIRDVCLRLLGRKQTVLCLQTLSPVFNLASSLGNSSDVLDVGLVLGVA